MEEILKLSEVSVQYPDFRLFPVTLQLYAGETLAILGESGSGKTTLARAISCLLPQSAKVSGQIEICGYPVSKMKEADLKKIRMEQFSVCFQSSSEWLNPGMKIYDQLAEVLIRKYSRKKIPQKAESIIRQVDLAPEDLNRYPKEMSGGMIQKFMIAMAIALQPRLIILDEPTSSLDSGAKQEIIKLIKKIRKTTAASFVLITHDILVAKELSEKTMILYQGEVVETGPTDQLLHAAHHPYTRGLIHSFPELFPYRDMWGIRPSDNAICDPDNHCVFFNRCTQRIDVCAHCRPLLKEGPPSRFVACHRGGIVKTLSAQGLQKKYGSQEVISNASLKVYSGELVAVVGKSGVGKTTLCSILAGFLKADGGEILFEGVPADYRKLHREKGGIQMVFQDSTSALNPRLTVSQVIGEPLKLSGEKNQETIHTTIQNLLYEVGLPTESFFLKKRTEELSGGQKQRVNLARALTMEPKLLVADEPTSMLDASSKANVLRLLKTMQNKKGCAMLLITHDLESARKIADRIYLVENGTTTRIQDHQLINLFQEDL
ncbi:MAG: ABC transporter ATP-binding protein [Clostridiales bacterium]|nr:ABC transporter ATP-binding protein [Clostridiales bacterium]